MVLGNACRDVLYHLDSLPRPGETLVARGIMTDLGGKGLNQAIAAKRAGADVHLVAAIGDDETAGEIRALLEAEELDDRGLIAGHGRSDESLLLLDALGENIIISATEKAQALTPAQAEARLTTILATADLLLLQGNLSQETTFHAIELARRAGIRVAVNPSPFQSWFKAMPPVDLVMVNQGEADALGKSPAEMTIITLGDRGCRLQSSSAVIDVPAPQIHAIASGGAGDVFAGTFIAEWLAVGDPERAARLAVAAASDKATRRGMLSAFPSRSSLETFRHLLQGSSS